MTRFTMTMQWHVSRRMRMPTAWHKTRAVLGMTLCSFAVSLTSAQTLSLPSIDQPRDPQNSTGTLQDVAAQADTIRAEQLDVAVKLVADFPNDFDAQRILGVV